MKGEYEFATRVIHAGQSADPTTSAVIPPISLSTTFKQSEVGVHKGFEYSRTGNPTRKNLEESLASLEGGKYGLAFASGSATTVSIVNMFPTGSHILSVNDVYGGTNRYFTKVASNQGYEVTFVDLCDPENILKAIKSNTKLIWIETPTNPTLRIVDIKRVCEIVPRKDLVIVVDNTFLSPYFQNPLSLGADIVVHSLTKYINGHSDCVMGAAITSRTDLYERLAFLQNAIGAVPSAFDCFLAHRGIKTLHLRMEQHQKNAFEIAKYLESNKEMVQNVIYPGLPSHPQHELAKKQQRGFGGMISFRIKGDAKKFLKNLVLFQLAESLGGVESLAELPCVMTHGAVSVEQRKVLGISENLVRLSVGIEDVKDLKEDISNALKKATE